MTLTITPEGTRVAGRLPTGTAEPVYLASTGSLITLEGQPSLRRMPAPVRLSAARPGTALPRSEEERHTAFGAFVEQLLELLLDVSNFDDEFLPPTQRAIEATLDTLYRAAGYCYFPLPAGHLYPDGDGGLRLDWQMGERQLRLVVHASDSSQDYLYHQKGTDYGVETGVTPYLLAGWICWLTESVK